ncbi:MAG: molybdenum cofactor biosysynthesis protein, partial [Alphaproteobacteria bacterium HGW-Alphaproteobacteria-2]
MTPRLAQIWRHPIKAHGRERLDAAMLEPGQTLPWDRHWAVAHEAAHLAEGAWSPCANFSRAAKTG